MRISNAKELKEWYPELEVVDWGVKGEWGVKFPDGWSTCDYGSVFTKRLVDEGKLSESALER